MKEKVLITRFDHQGRGIGKIGEKVIFVPFALPDDEVEVEIMKNKKNYCEGHIVRYIKRSSKHLEQLCPYYQKCGGCDLRHISYDEELQFKEQKIYDIMRKYVKEDMTINPILKCEDRDFYRNKLSLKVDKGLGFNQKNTHDITHIDECLIADKKINKILQIIKEMRLTSIENVVIRVSRFTPLQMVVFYIKKGCQFNENLDNLRKKVDSIVLVQNNKQEIIYGKGNIFEKLQDLTFKISPSSFFQVNSLQTLKLYQLIYEKCQLSGKEIVYDLYAGTGTIGLFLSKGAKKIISIEINKDAVSDALENIKLNHISNVVTFCGDVASVIKSQTEKPDIIVVDPPRSGLDKITIENIFRLNPRKIIYTSCDPVTLARDLNLMKENYNISDITPVDMFPNTYHVESVCILVHK